MALVLDEARLRQTPAVTQCVRCADLARNFTLANRVSGCLQSYCGTISHEFITLGIWEVLVNIFGLKKARMRMDSIFLRPIALVAPCCLLLSACGGGSDTDSPHEQTKADCIEHFKAERPQVPGNLIAFDAWEKDGKVIVEFGTETETGKGKNKKMVRTVVDHCIYDPKTELFRLPMPFDTSWSRDGSPVKRDTTRVSPQAPDE